LTGGSILKSYLHPFLVLIIAGSATTAASQERATSTPESDSQIPHILERLTFGPRPGDIAALRKVGLQNRIKSQLHPDSIAENPALENRFQPLASLRMNLVGSAANGTANRTIIAGTVILLDGVQNSLAGPAH
jgi:hypothetical protein